MNVTPTAYPVLGHIPFWLTDRFGFLRSCATSGLKICELKLGERAYLLNYHEDIRHVLDTHYTNYLKNERLIGKTGQRLFGEGVQTQRGTQHRQQRRQVQPVFIHRAIAAFTPQILATVNAQLSTWCSVNSNTTEIDLSESILTLVHCVMGRLLFGLDFVGADRPLGQAIIARRQRVDRQFSLMGRLSKSLAGYAMPGRATQNASLSMLEHAVEQMVQARREHPEQHQDLLSMLVQRQAAQSNRASQQLRDEALATTGGYETIAALIIWTLYWLARSPEVEARFLHECEQTVGARLPTVEDLPRLPYTKQVMSESLRLCPPTWIFTRRPLQTERLPSGTLLAPGDKLYLSPYVLHRNPAYFRHPDRFDPQRFDKARRREQADYAFFPFGAGPRICIGRALVETVATLILVRIAQRVRLRLVPNQKVVPKTSITLLPKQPLRMQVSSVACL